MNILDEKRKSNPLFLTDVYNLSHPKLKRQISQTWECSHIYNRKEGMLFTGFLYKIYDLFTTKITMDMVNEASEGAKKMGVVFPIDVFKKVVEECNGYMPLTIRAVPEGTWCPTKTPHIQIKNTVEGFGDLVTWWESQLFPWCSSGATTESMRMYLYTLDLMKQYGYDDSFLWRLHNFGLRSHRNYGSSYVTDIGWQMFLKGTDSFHVVQAMPNTPCGSIFASAHKVTQTFGKEELECAKFAIDSTAKEGLHILAMPIDTINAHNFISKYVLDIVDYGIEKDVKIVFRPDSGDVKDQAIRIYELAVANDIVDNCAVIIGEDMSYENVKIADRYFNKAGVPLNFISYGVGSGFHQHIVRDTYGYAMKTCVSGGEPCMKVVEGNTFKMSIPNEIHLYYNEDEELTIGDGEDLDNDIMETYYYYDKNMKKPFIKDLTLEYWENIRKVAHESVASGKINQLSIKLSKETKYLQNSLIEEYTE